MKVVVIVSLPSNIRQTFVFKHPANICLQTSSKYISANIKHFQTSGKHLSSNIQQTFVCTHPANICLQTSSKHLSANIWQIFVCKHPANIWKIFVCKHPANIWQLFVCKHIQISSKHPKNICLQTSDNLKFDPPQYFPHFFHFWLGLDLFRTDLTPFPLFHHFLDC